MWHFNETEKESSPNAQQQNTEFPQPSPELSPSLLSPRSENNNSNNNYNTNNSINSKDNNFTIDGLSNNNDNNSNTGNNGNIPKSAPSVSSNNNSNNGIPPATSDLNYSILNERSGIPKDTVSNKSSPKSPNSEQSSGKLDYSISGISMNSATRAAVNVTSLTGNITNNNISNAIGDTSHTNSRGLGVYGTPRSRGCTPSETPRGRGRVTPRQFSTEVPRGISGTPRQRSPNSPVGSDKNLKSNNDLKLNLGTIPKSMLKLQTSPQKMIDEMKLNKSPRSREFLYLIQRLDTALQVVHRENKRLLGEKRNKKQHIENYQRLLVDLKKLWYTVSPTLRGVARTYFERRGLDLDQPYQECEDFDCLPEAEVEDLDDLEDLNYGAQKENV